jgi:hypothetical protein
MKAEVNRIVVLLLLITGFLFVGCTSINIPDKARAEFVDIFQEQSLSDYRLLDSHKSNFEFIFKPAKKDSIFRRVNEELFIDLFLVDKNKIQISLSNQYDDRLLREFKGAFDENTFRFKTKWFLAGNPLVWGLGTHDNILVKNSSGEILLYHTRGGVGFVTLVPVMGTSNGTDIHRFEKNK